MEQARKSLHMPKRLVSPAPCSRRAVISGTRKLALFEPSASTNSAGDLPQQAFGKHAVGERLKGRHPGALVRPRRSRIGTDPHLPKAGRCGAPGALLLYALQIAASNLKNFMAEAEEARRKEVEAQERKTQGANASEAESTVGCFRNFLPLETAATTCHCLRPASA